MVVQKSRFLEIKLLKVTKLVECEKRALNSSSDPRFNAPFLILPYYFWLIRDNSETNLPFAEITMDIFKGNNNCTFCTTYTIAVFH